MIDFLLNLTYLESVDQLLLVGLIVGVAGIVRGCIGFGFSAILVASTSFWLPAAAVVNTAVFLEIFASIGMLPSIRGDVKLSLLLPLVFAAALTTFIGIWLLATLPPTVHQWIVGIYMVIVGLLTLSGVRLKGEATTQRIFGVGLVAGFFNGFAAVGGIFAAWGLVGLRQTVREIRATLAIYFFLVELLFLIGAYGNGILSWEIFWTAVLALMPLLIGLWLGTNLFHNLPEATLKTAVIIALIALSLLGIFKTIF